MGKKERKPVYRTAREIEYNMAWAGRTVIPAGTECEPAVNLSLDKGRRYWCKRWKGMNAKESGWSDTYGFLVTGDEVEEASAP